MFDVLIKEGLIYDGKGSKPFRADMAIKDGKIFLIKSKIEKKAQTIIDAKNKAVTPGFIDTHGHSDIISWAMKDYDFKIRQGVTTEVMGSCGLSVAPCNSKYLDLLDKYIETIKCGLDFEWKWESFSQYLNYVEEQSLVNNLIPFVGHGTIRMAVMGFSEKSPNQTELKSMQQLVRKALEAGAFGLSAGLVYPPGNYGDFKELVALNEIVSEFSGVFSVHMRNESDNLLLAIEEVIKIAQRTDVKLLISHFKSMGQSNWNKLDKALELIKEAQDSGVSVWVDQYPYTANSTFLNALVPPGELNQGLEDFLQKLENDNYAKKIISKIELNKGGNWENFVANAGGWEGVMLLSLPNTPKWNGKFITDIAQETNKKPGEVFIDLLLKNRGHGLVINFTMSEENVKKIMKKPFQMFGSDGLPGESGGHPRLYGTFPKIFNDFTGHNSVLNLPEAVKKMTSLPAQVFDLKNRGVIAEGKIADINIIDFDNFRDRATYQNPMRPPTGVKAVLLAGEIVLNDDKLAKNEFGKVLRN